MIVKKHTQISTKISRLLTKIIKISCLTPHTSKLQTKIIYKHIKNNIKNELDNEQFAFRKNSDMREANLFLTNRGLKRTQIQF